MSRPELTYDEAIESIKRRWLSFVSVRTGDDCWLWAGYINPQTGYGQLAIPLSLVRQGWPRTITAPRLSCIIHHGEPAGRHVLHSCGNRRCCNPSHLRWGSHDENMQDRVLDGHQNTQKLSPDDVRLIRAAFESSTAGKMETYEQLADSYGVRPDTIRDIIRGRSWSWLT